MIALVAGGPQQKQQGKPGRGIPTNNGYRDLGAISHLCFPL